MFLCAVYSEKTIEEELDNPTAYYQVNGLRATDKKVVAFHLRNRGQ